MTRSIVLLTPNGLPQRMQWNGSSSLSTRAAAVAARKSSCGSSVITFSGQVALHSPHCTQASSAKRSIGRSGSSSSAPVGQADTQARQSVQPSTLTSTAPNGAPCGQRDRRRPAPARRGAARAARAACTSRLPPTGRKLAGRGAALAAARSRAAPRRAHRDRRSRSSRRGRRRSRGRRGSARASASVAVRPGDVVARLARAAASAPPTAP